MATSPPINSAPLEPDQDPLAGGPKISDVSALAFGLYGAPIEQIMQRVDNYKGPRDVLRLETIHRRVSGIDDDKATVATVAVEPTIIKPVIEDPKPKRSFSAAATPAPTPVSTTPLPDLTNAYLDKLIGWYRQKEGVNPRANALHVWTRDEFEQWHKSPRESWAAINQALTNRERNVETPATNLVEYIKSTRLNLTRERLEQLLDWYKEKTGKPHKKLQDVWVKDTGEWELAPYRWSEIEREFIYPEVRAALGAETLQDYKRQRVTEAIDQLVMAQGPLLAARPA